MPLRKLCTVAFIAASLAGASALADDRANKRTEIRKVAQQSLQDFYKVEPKLKEEVAKAPGYAVFSSYGFSLIFGGAGGKGLAHDNKARSNAYMNMAQASVGVQIGASDTRYLFVFDTAKDLQRFIDTGWEAGAGGGAGAGASKGTVGGSAGGFTGGKMYMLTKTGLQAGGAVAGTKFWKDKELN